MAKALLAAISGGYPGLRRAAHHSHACRERLGAGRAPGMEQSCQEEGMGWEGKGHASRLHLTFLTIVAAGEEAPSHV